MNHAQFFNLCEECTYVQEGGRGGLDGSWKAAFHSCLSVCTRVRETELATLYSNLILICKNDLVRNNDLILQEFRERKP